MKLLIDAGNSLIKWAFVKDGEWLANGVLAIGQASELPQHLTDISQVEKIWVSNVAGEKVAQHIRKLASEVHFIASSEAQCGVRNRYANPAQLGSDRWAGLIAAWHLIGGACLVVSSGTATTVDALDQQGEFIGGLILPGIAMMQQSLATETAQLKSHSGEYAAFPLNTADAIFSGVIQATCGAIQRQYALLNDNATPIVLSGGAGAVLQSRLGSLPLRIVDNLVLQGLWLIAQEATHD
jgi:type III pantothenate kinase